MSLRVLATAGAVAVLAAGSAAAAACPAVSLTPPGGVARPDGRSAPLDVERLARLVDVKGFAASPDGRWLFVAEQAANPDRGAYDTRWSLRPADCSGAARVLDTEGRAVTHRYYGGVHGAVLVEAPKWSPDGRRVAYRKERGPLIELWVADVAAGTVRQVDAGSADVERFRWTASGVLLFQTGLDRARFADQKARERAEGFLYDDRFHVSSGLFEPMTPDCRDRAVHSACERALKALEAGAAAPRPATPEEQADWSVETEAAARLKTHPLLAKAARDGRLAWAANADPERFKGPRPLRRVAAGREGAPKACAAPACVGQIEGLWWNEAEDAVVFLKREGSQGRADQAPFDVTTAYRWEPAMGRLIRLFATADAVDECSLAGEALDCLMETSRRPGRVVRFDARTGVARVLHDPNPDVAAGADIRLRKVPYADASGNAGYYYVVTKGDPAAGPRPAVVVQYGARGFLRGGTGDEYPIYPLAEAGFAVLAFTTASNPLQTSDLGPPSELLERRAASAGAVEAAIDELARAGAIDPKRVAITGLSSGSETAHWALQRRGGRYAAAITSQGALERNFLAITTPRYQNFKKRYGYPRIYAAGVLDEIAWSVRPDALVTPLLVNVTQKEFLQGYEGFAALRDAGRPVEVRVFTDEGRHVKHSPANRAAVYRLNLRWLAYWLQGARSADPDLAEEYRRWDAMRDQLTRERGAAAGR